MNILLKKDKYWAKPSGNMLRKLEQLLGVGIDDANFTEKFLETQCIKVTDKFLIHKDIYQQYLNVQENKIPCGYIWFDITDLKFEIIGLKNGQASTGDIKKRVTSYGTRGTQILLDIIEDEYFLIKNNDQRLNKKIESDYYSNYKIEVEDSKTTRTKENVLVPRSLIFDFPQLKRNTLEKILNKKLVKRNFHASVSHEDCLRKLTNNSTSQYFLLDCVMRFGKSFIYYEYIKREYVDKGKVAIHTVFCHDTKTVDGWLEKADIYYTELFDCIELKKDKSFDFNQKVSKNTIVFISQQLLHSNKDLSNPNEVYTQPLQDLINIDVKCENTFVDEVHQYFSSKWKSYFESITHNQIILASGTAAKVKLEYPDLFDEYNTHTDTLNDLKERLFKEFGIKIITTIKRINVSDLGFGKVNMANLQSTDENGKLVHPSLGIKLFDSIFKDFRTSPMAQDDISEIPKHCPIYVDTVEFGRLLFNYLTTNPQLNIVPIMVAGESKYRTVNTETDLKDLIKKQNSDGKSTVMITCGSMIQGVSVEEWKDMINLSVVGTYEMFYQFFGRGWEIDTTKEYKKPIHITMWDYNPHRTLKVGAQFIQSLAMTNGLDIPKAFQYYFQIHNIVDYVPNGSSFREVSTATIESEIREFIDTQVLNRGCKARLVTNTRPDVMMDISDELLKTFLEAQSVNVSNKKVKELESYKTNLLKQKTNHSKKSHDLEIPKIPKQIEDVWQSAINGLSTYTERIPLVIEVMYNEGKLKTKNVKELLDNHSDDSFISGFKFPNTNISKQFSEYILKYGNLQRINIKVDNSIDIIPSIVKCLNMAENAFLDYGDAFDKMYKYSGDDTQLSVRDSYKILKEQLKNLKLKVGQKLHINYAKSGALNLALTYLLYENSIKIFGKQLTKEQVIESVSFEDENTFFESLVSTMGFIKSNNSKKDFIVINPPYKRGKHLEIFNKAFEELNDGGTLICIHPSVQFLNAKPTDDTNTLLTRNIVSTYKTQLKFVNGNDIFNAGFFTPLSITTVQKTKNPEIEVIYSHIDSLNNTINVYNNLDDIFIHANDIVLSIKNRLLSKSYESVSKHLYRTGCIGETYIKFNILAGNKPKNGKLNPDFYCLIYKDFENKLESVITTTPNGKKVNGGAINELALSKPEYSKNAFEYLKTKFVRFCLSLRKTGGDINLVDMEFIPYLDFSKEWTDEKLFEHFDFNDDEIKFVNEYIPNWYEQDFK
jgi:hypothetical protein